MMPNAVGTGQYCNLLIQIALMVYSVAGTERHMEYCYTVVVDMMVVDVAGRGQNGHIVKVVGWHYIEKTAVVADGSGNKDTVYWALTTSSPSSRHIDPLQQGSCCGRNPPS